MRLAEARLQHTRDLVELTTFPESAKNFKVIQLHSLLLRLEIRKVRIESLQRCRALLAHFGVPIFVHLGCARNVRVEGRACKKGMISFFRLGVLAKLRT